MFKNLIWFVIILFAVASVGWMALRRADIPYSALENAYANEASQFVSLEDGLKVHYRDEGLIDGPTIILVHGFSASLHTWEAWVANLKRDHRVISLDLPGHGLTQTPEEYPLTIDQFVSVVDEVTDYLGADQFTLVGSSMGGNTAWEFALARPDKLEGLVLVGTSGWPRSADEIENQPFVFRLLANPTARYLLKDLDMKMFIRGGLEDSFVDQSLVTDAMVNRYASLSLAPGRREAILDMMATPAARREATDGLLATLSVPTLVLHGDQDNLVPVGGAHRFADAIPNAELVIYENVGHLPQEEIAERSLTDIRRFIAARIAPGRIEMEKADLTSSPELAVVSE